MKLAITICRPCKPKCLYEFTGDIETVRETYVVDVPNMPNAVVMAANEGEAEGCVIGMSFIREE